MTETDLVRASADFDGWDPSSIFSGDLLSSTRRTIESFPDDDDDQSHAAVKRESLEKDLQENDHVNQREIRPFVKHIFNHCIPEISDIDEPPPQCDEETCDPQNEDHKLIHVAHELTNQSGNASSSEKVEIRLSEHDRVLRLEKLAGKAKSKNRVKLTKKERENQGNTKSELLAEVKETSDYSTSGRIEISEERDIHEKIKLDSQKETEAKIKKEKHNEIRKNKGIKMIEMRRAEEKRFKEVEERLIREENERIYQEQKSIQAQERLDSEGRKLMGEKSEKSIISDDENSLISQHTNTSNSAEMVGKSTISESGTPLEKEEGEEEKEVTADDDSLEHSALLDNSSQKIPRTHDMTCELADCCDLEDSLVVRDVAHTHENHEDVRKHSDSLSNSATENVYGSIVENSNSGSDDNSIDDHSDELNVVRRREDVDGDIEDDDDNSDDNDNNRNNSDDADDDENNGENKYNTNNGKNDTNKNNNNDDNDNDDSNIDDDNPHTHLPSTAPHSIWLKGSAARTIQRIFRGLLGRYILKLL